MIGYYIHHQGSGHLRRATQLAAALGEPVTGLSSLPRPDGWAGDWVHLARDDDGVDPQPDAGWDICAGGKLNWAPRHHPGLRRRSAQISSWLDEKSPDLFIVDVSVEVTMLARLHGVPVVSVALPGNRTDGPHQLGYAVTEAVVGFWPAEAASIIDGVDTRLGPEQRPSFYALGGLSRFEPLPERNTRPGSSSRLSVVVLNGTGGGAIPPATCYMISETMPDVELTVLGGDGGSWHTDPWPALQKADVVITTAGQNAVAEVAASRTPAVVVALPRPHKEQVYMCNTLFNGPWPALASPEVETVDTWRETLQHALDLDGRAWEGWCDGLAAQRFSEVLSQIRTRISDEVLV